MKRLALVLLVAAGALVIAGTAEAASYRVIRWNVTRVCQIYNFGFGFAPIPRNYHVLTGPLPSFAAAVRAKDALWRRGACSL
jgi:hypothetical protein